MIKCLKCNKIKDDDEFNNGGRYKSWHRYWCDECVADYRKNGLRGDEKAICRKCKQILPITDFYLNTGFPLGHSTDCLPCWQAKSRAYKEKARLEKWKAKQKLKRQTLRDADYFLGGWNIYIQNHSKENEFKFNILSTRGEIYQTDDFNNFINYLKGNIND